MTPPHVRATLGAAACLPLLLGAVACATDSEVEGSGGENGAIDVTASDDSCSLSRTDLDAGPNTFNVTNDGSRVTEFYVYAEGDRIMGEVENIGPGLSRKLVVDLPADGYEGACKPGMVGDGIRADIDVSGEPAKDLSDSAELKQAADSYERYVQSQTGALVEKTDDFVAAVKAGDVDKAKALFPVARTYWERIEPVAEKFGDLDPAVDEREPDVEPGSEFTGYHRIEKQLWVAGDTKGMGPIADQLQTDIDEIVRLAAESPLTALELAQGSKNLLDEVATGKITGEEDEFSHTDLWDFKANIEGSKAAIAAIRPVLEEQDPDLVALLDERTAALETELNQYQNADGTWKSYDELSKAQIKRLSDAVAAVSEPISQVAGVVSESV
ncbi:iron uptake system protein EfeO [Solicola gregarius]|uniref:PbrT family lead (Pb2+) uptake porter n=1 Tax=Solicola gregarius TaxID=2908642 RepID=A0AA46TEZ5_9ACTN|nr:iron uptake system protein EfeO [Solicola gregarius]UYM03861.1 PbrT family lead (Pb2+) uptake porter [Solicola gregarius]